MLGWAEGLNFCVCDVLCYDKKNGEATKLKINKNGEMKVFVMFCEMRRMARLKNKKVKRMAR